MQVMHPVVAAVIVAGTISAHAATIQVVPHLNTATGFEPAGAALLQQGIDNGGVLAAGPSEIAVEDVLDPNALFWAATVSRITGETNPITLDGLSFEQSSSDAGNAFAFSQSYSGFNYDGSLIRGFKSGPDNMLWTADDLEAGVDFSNAGTEIVDGIAIYLPGTFFDDTGANRTYFGGELDFTVDVTVTAVDKDLPILEFGEGSNSVDVTAVPEPSTAAAVAVIGGLALLRRRR